MYRRFFVIIASLIALLVLVLTAYLLGQRSNSPSKVTSTPAIISATPQPDITESSSPSSTLMPSSPNPASAFCIQKGGTLTIETRGDGGQYGLCTFDMGYACEEWAMFRGECPVGGLRTTGFDTIEEKYCAWSGGSTLAVENAACKFKNGKTCSAKAYYNGTCTN